MPKDRSRRVLLSADVQILVERSSAHPVEYAITLLARRDGSWQAVRCFDNAHGSEEHHEHRYRGGTKQDPIVSHGAVNEAMNAALVKLRASWADIVRSWDQTR